MAILKAFAWALLLLDFLSSPSFSKEEEWYTECDGMECGYGGGGDASDSCRDLDKNCRDFALRGECFANPDWMVNNCPKACGSCNPQLSTEECVDLHSSCPKWAHDDLECFGRPGYMMRACRASCWQCIDNNDAVLQGKSKEERDRIVKFSQTDFGLWQSIPETIDAAYNNKVRQHILDMGRYTMTLPKLGSGTVCNNMDHSCAQWAVDQGCDGDNMEYMLSHCSLACHYCDVVEDYHSCRTQTKSDQQGLGPIESLLEMLMAKSTNLLQVDDNQSNEKPLGEQEWVISLDKNKLWEHEPTGSSEELLNLLKATLSEGNSHNGLHWEMVNTSTRSGQFAKCGTHCQDSNPPVKILAFAISNLLQIYPSYLETLEFVHYKRGERFASHHDYRLHDGWKQSGHRLMTIFINLQPPTEGGGFGFPELDWLFVKEPAVLIWPNVQSNKRKLERMQSEQLPVVQGEMFGVYAWVREYPHDDLNICS